MSVAEGTRWSGADWADQQTDITLIGVGGIGSWTALALSRIGHNITIIDPDIVDITNVKGGQFYKKSNIGEPKVECVKKNILELGCSNDIITIADYFEDAEQMDSICISALDNMETRKNAFNSWMSFVETERKHIAPMPAIFIDGRLLLETLEIFAVDYDNKDAIKEYQEKWLFEDKDVPDLDCTSKQTTFSAMIIGGLITSVLCNFLTNCKLAMEFRDVPFHQRMYLPIFDYKLKDVELCQTKPF